MKIFLFCLMISTMYANDAKIASSIFENIVSAITQKTNSKIYIHTEIKSIRMNPNNMTRVKNCEDADVVLLSETKNIPQSCEGKILFGTRYYHLKNKNVVGAFFWQKGRPNILFYKERLDEKNIKLDSSFDKYVEN